MVATFFGPRELLLTFRKSTPWLGPLVISTAVAMVLVFTVPEAEFVAQMEGATSRRGEPVTITSEPGEIARYGRYLRMMSAAVFQPIVAFGLAAVLTAIFRGILGGAAHYAQYLTITTHALLITAAGRLLAAPLALARDNPDTSISLALLAPAAGPGRALFTVLQGMNLFTIWALLFCALGVSIVDPDHPWRRASVLILGGYFLLVIGVAMIATRTVT